MYSLTKYARSLNDISLTDNTVTLGLKLTEFTESPLTESGRDSGRMKVMLSSPASGIIRINCWVRYTGKDETKIINTRPSATGIVEQSDDDIIFKSGTLEAKISKNGTFFRIIFSYCGIPITATALNAFFNTQRPSEYTGACFDITPGESCFGLGGGGSVDIIGHKEITDNSNESAAFNKVPFFVSSRGYGIFVNSIGAVKFDIASQSGSIAFSQEGESIEFYVFAGNNPAEVIGSYVNLVGRDDSFESLTEGLSLNYNGSFDFTDESIISEIEQANGLGITISELWLGNG